MIASYRLTTRDMNRYPEAQPNGLWASIIASNYFDLTEVLNTGDPPALATTLNGMFGSRITTGLSMGGEVDYLRSASGRQLYVARWLDGLMSFASYLGLVRESMEFGESLVRTAEGIREIHDAIEKRIGNHLSFPKVCSAWGVSFGSRFMPHVGWRHLHFAHATLEHASTIVCPRIVEVGGGFGGVCFWAYALARGMLRYTIYDFPILNVIAGYFLLRAMPDEPVVLYGEGFDPRRETPHVAVLPNYLIEDEPDTGADIAINQDSLPEMPRTAALRYLAVFDRIVRVGFYSENQESGTPWNLTDQLGSAQLCLPDLEQWLERLHRVYRFRAWMRRGYFETFYRPNDPSPLGTSGDRRPLDPGEAVL